jgi:hypothetical protein
MQDFDSELTELLKRHERMKVHRRRVAATCFIVTLGSLIALIMLQ